MAKAFLLLLSNGHSHVFMLPPLSTQAVPSAHLGRIGAIGGPTSSALSGATGGHHQAASPPPSQAQAQGQPQPQEQQREEQQPRKPSMSVKEALLPVIDLLSFEDEPTPGEGWSRRY